MAIVKVIVYKDPAYWEEGDSFVAERQIHMPRDVSWHFAHVKINYGNLFKQFIEYIKTKELKVRMCLFNDLFWNDKITAHPYVMSITFLLRFFLMKSNTI